MNEKKPFKKPPKKFQPPGLNILYEDWDILVVDKEPGMLSVGSDTNDESALDWLNEYVKKGNSKSKNRIFVVHRLEKDISGLLVFAKTDQAKLFLKEKWPDFKKKYVAVVQGAPPEEQGVVTSFLAENSIHLMYSVSDASLGKFARTSYQILKKSKTHSLIEVCPMTERKNQVRVHLADLGCPVEGDKKYGKKGAGIKRLCLHAASISLVHPFSKESMTFEAPVPGYFQSLISR
ncbi:MAG: RluA family pseudouridine synthase [Kiritimatiellaceae bacterium]|nr:RluA family pseudouridine synthase [Kiritimatiellaceae bacterium]